MTATKEKVWREVERLRTWDHADMLRKTTIDENPSLDVRLRCEMGVYIVEVSGPEKR